MKTLAEKLVYYAQKHLDLSPLDAVYVKNLIMSAFRQDSPDDTPLCPEERDKIDSYTVPDELVEELKSVAVQHKLCQEGMEESFAALIFGLLSPAPQALADNFYRIYNSESKKAATGYLYSLCIKNNYIQKTAIERNLYWKAQFESNYIEVTVNLSKPEKDNREIARSLAQPQTAYPKCMLCLENLGYSGSLVKPPRQNLRIIPLTLAGEPWFMQYSPYLYYDRHCIAVSFKHSPMVVDASTPRKLCDFVEIFPHFFIGSNASLPIVGGSILSHEHFQGGAHKMPVHYAKDLRTYECKSHPRVNYSTVDWFNSVVRLRSADKEGIISAAADLIDFWNDYRDEECGIISHTGDTRHNAVTPIMRLEDGSFILDAILRNNRTSAQHPDGIFHAHSQYHNIKKEGIGLIEAMGMFILPGRLKRETGMIADILSGKCQETAGLDAHADMISALMAQCGGKTQDRAQADILITDYINGVCKNILINTAVFKPDADGRAAFDRFMRRLTAK